MVLVRVRALAAVLLRMRQKTVAAHETSAKRKALCGKKDRDDLLRQYGHAKSGGAPRSPETTHRSSRTEKKKNRDARRRVKGTECLKGGNMMNEGRLLWVKVAVLWGSEPACRCNRGCNQRVENLPPSTLSSKPFFFFLSRVCVRECAWIALVVHTMKWFRQGRCKGYMSLPAAVFT